MRRMQQRGIPRVILEWMDFGAAHEQAGATVYSLNWRSRRRLATYTGGMSERCGHWLAVCVVTGREGRIITTFFRDERINSK